MANHPMIQAPLSVSVDLSTGIQLHTLQWPGEKRPFVLLHGLSSNAATWKGVASRLTSAGHRVIAVDQRGHGLSDKPDSDYGFAAVTDDLASLIERLELSIPVIAGQSWGGNVVLEYAAHYPGTAHGLVFVDGGFLNLQGRSTNGADTSWEAVSARLAPPSIDGMRRTDLEKRIRSAHSSWPEWGIDATLRNFEWLPDGTIRRWLPEEQHMLILRALWEQQPPELYPGVVDPVLICPADDGNQEWLVTKTRQVAAAEDGLSHSKVHWFHDTSHDIHIQRAENLANLMLDSLTAD